MQYPNTYVQQSIAFFSIANQLFSALLAISEVMYQGFLYPTQFFPISFDFFTPFFDHSRRRFVIIFGVQIFLSATVDAFISCESLCACVRMLIGVRN